VQEVRQFHLDAIARARHSLLFENQYFTSASVGEALRQRLGEQDGPDVVVVSARVESGWLEAATMGVLRARLHRELCSADRQGRYRMYCPHIPDLAPGCLNVHSKVMIVDDEILTIGSANLNNRSMVLDTECNLALEAGGDARVARAIARVRERLLGEHLDAAPERVAQVHAQKGRLIAAIDALRGSGRTLHPLDPVVTPEQEALLPPRAWIDPEQPMAADELVGHLVSREAGPPVARRVARLAAAALMIGLVAVAWRWTPLREWVNLSAMVGYAQHLDELPMSSLAIIAAYVVGGVLIVPVTALIAVTGIVFGPMLGVAYAIAGTLASAAATYGLGRWLGRDTVRRFAGDQINRVSRRIAQRGVLAIVIVRVVPVAPFSVINIIAGASHIRWRDFMLGTALGMTPGIVVTVTFAHQLALAIRHPSLVAIAVLAVIAAVLVALAMLLGRKLGRRGRDPG
jgi:uncharacterized membrane protein YdjX (TVP38/TMEM64 family)